MALTGCTSQSAIRSAAVVAARSLRWAWSMGTMNPLRVAISSQLRRIPTEICKIGKIGARRSAVCDPSTSIRLNRSNEPEMPTDPGIPGQ